jgi:Tfp pilus assembly protein PilV
MTLTEVLVAFVVLMIVMIPLGYLFTTEVTQAASTRNQLAALAVAEKWVEILSTAQDPPPNSGSLAVDANVPLVPKLPNGTSVPSETRGGTVFYLHSEYTWTGTQDASAAPNLCQTGGAQVLNLTVTVSWGDGQQVTDTTVLNFPAPGIPQYGFYRLQISGDTSASDTGGNSWSDRVQAIPVILTPTPTGSAVTIYPDQYGCVFAELSPGTYTVSSADPSPSGPPNSTGYGSPSFVENLATNGSPNEPTAINPIPNANPVTITAGITTPLTTVYYDEGGTVGLSYPSSTATSDGVTCPGADQITCISQGEGTTGSLGTTSPLATMAWTSGASWSTASIPPSPSVTRIASIACAGSTACIGVGYGYTGTTAHATIEAENAATPSVVAADTVPTLVSGGIVTSLTQVVCPTSSACVAWGTSSSGPVALAGTISSSGDTWNVIGLPAAFTRLNQLVCTSSLACVAVGSGGGVGLVASGPIYGTGGAPAAGTWVLSNAPTGFTLSSLNQVACPAALACMAFGTGTVGGNLGPIIVSGSPVIPANGLGSVLNWTRDANPTPAPNSFTQLVCPSAATCLVVGTSGTKAIIDSGTPGVATMTNDALPTTTTSLSQLACPSGGVCVAIGSGTSGPVILSGTIGTPDTWSPPAASGIPSSIYSVSAITCPNATVCAIAASTTDANNNPLAAILSGSPGSSSTWSSVAIPSPDASTLYLTGISCMATTGTATCSAVGTSSTGAVIMMSTGGPSGTWIDDSGDANVTLTGSPTSNIPIELTNSGLTNQSGSNGAWSPVAATPAGRANTTAISDIYPFAGGYGLFGGDCTAEDFTNGPGTTTAPVTPGNTATSPSTTVPLAVLPIQVNSSTGVPESGDVLTLTATTPTCAADAYTLQPTGPDGLSRTEVPFGTYTLKVMLPVGSTSSTFANVVVAPGKVTVGLSGPQYLLPLPATVVGP